MNFPKEVSSEFLEKFVDDIVASRLHSVIGDSGCSYTIKIDRDFNPEILVHVDDPYITVIVGTIELEENSQPIGWAFQVEIYNDEMHFSLGDSDPASSARIQYNVWAKVAAVCEAIADLEIIPSDYADFEDMFY